MQDSLPDLNRFVAELQARGPFLAARCADAVKPYAPVGPVGGGALRDSLVGQVTLMSAEQMEIEVTSDAPQAEYVIHGRGPVDGTEHPLRFEINGEVLFRWHVKAAAANPFGEQATADIEAVVNDEVQQAAAAAFS